MGKLAQTALVATVLGTAGVGCFLITGSTSGYQLAPPEAGVCAVDAASLGFMVSCACASSADCHGDGGAQFCCFALMESTASAGSTCQANPCDAALGAQLCKTTKECVDAACVAQTCSYSGVSIPVQACGTLPNCTP